jgi:hypothetical protein
MFRTLVLTLCLVACSSDDDTGSNTGSGGSAGSSSGGAAGSTGGTAGSTGGTAGGSAGATGGSAGVDAGTCAPSTSDPSAIETDCEAAPCRAGYHCQIFVGFVVQEKCQILCEADCECPSGYLCQPKADQSGAEWKQCEPGDAGTFP